MDSDGNMPSPRLPEQALVHRVDVGVEEDHGEALRSFGDERIHFGQRRLEVERDPPPPSGAIRSAASRRDGRGSAGPGM